MLSAQLPGLLAVFCRRGMGLNLHSWSYGSENTGKVHGEVWVFGGYSRR